MCCSYSRHGTVFKELRLLSNDETSEDLGGASNMGPSTVGIWMKGLRIRAESGLDGTVSDLNFSCKPRE